MAAARRSRAASICSGVTKQFGLAQHGERLFGGDAGHADSEKTSWISQGLPRSDIHFQQRERIVIMHQPHRPLPDRIAMQSLHGGVAAPVQANQPHLGHRIGGIAQVIENGDGGAAVVAGQHHVATRRQRRAARSGGEPATCAPAMSRSSLKITP